MKILVIGDGCNDMFRYGRCERLSPEAPVPIFLPIRDTVNGGMALNVADNIESLGVKCDLITNDIRPMKTRLVDEVSNQIIVRIDENDKIKEIIAKDFDNIDFSQYDAVVISDYDKGFLSDTAIRLITERHNLVFMDTKKKLDSWANGVKVIKLNEKEFNENYEWLLHHVDGDVIMTRGKDGAVLNFSQEFPIEDEHPVRDLSGAGDTFLAGLVVKYLEKNNIEEAIRFANKCASWVVTQKGVVAVDPKQLQ